MRCPKCSYISYDIVETCVKCGKDISKAAGDLSGTVAGVPSPSFLRIPGQEQPPEVPEETVEVEAEEPLDLGAEAEEEAVDFSLEEEPSAEAADSEIDLGVEEEAEAEIDLGEEEPELDLGGEEAAVEEAPEAGLDFGLEEEATEEEEAIGISDLAPTEEAEEAAEVEVAEEAETAAGGQGLEDLKVDGLDLESAPDAEDTDEVKPSVKTGTALDDFDVDLGDLISSKD